MEVETSKFLAKEMRSYGFKVTENVGGTGIVAILENGKGPKILIRTDMDALPILEKTGVSYASTVVQKDIDGIERPVMHACGHDMHMSIWLGTAAYLASHKNEWKGSLMMIGQPAEERGGGSKAMLDDGLYSRFFVPDYGFAIHIRSDRQVGSVSYCPGYAMANVDMAKITFIGRGGHGAYPHTTIDPIAMASQYITDIQTIVSREITPTDPAVVTVGSFHAGTKGNVIPTEAKLELTIRSYKDEVREHVLKSLQRKATAIANSYRVPKENLPVFELRDTYTPALYNNPALVNKVVPNFENIFGKENVIKADPSMGGEDFARYGKTKEKVPIFMFFVSVVNKEKYERYKREGKQLPSLHSDLVIPDPTPSLEVGIKAMVTAVKSVQ
jgi:hippurate hydrolase